MIFMVALTQYSASMALRISLEASPGFITKLSQAKHLVYGFAPLVFGRLADVYSRPISLAFALFLFILGCIISAASPNAAAFAVGTVFHTIGMAGIGLLAAVFAGDFTPLKWRGAALSWTYLPYLMTVWAGPAFFIAVDWRWTYGMATIVVFVICTPALYLLFSATRSHDIATLSSPTLRTPKIGGITSRMDLAGLLIFTLGFALTEYGSTTMVIRYDRHANEYPPGRIAMLVVGLLLTFPVFILWELYCAPFPLMPGRVLRRKGVLFAVVISFLFRFASDFAEGNVGYNTPWTWTIGDIGYFFAAITIAFSAGAPLLGAAYYAVRRYKPFLITGNVLFIVGCALWLHATRHYNWDPEANEESFPTKAYLFTTQVLIGMGEIAVVMSALIGGQASVTHDDLAIVTALVFSWSQVAGTLGSSAVVAVSLRSDSDAVKSTITLGLALGFSLLCLVLSFFAPNFVLGDKQNAVEAELDTE
ncbi:unnamed protein product [Rhizoctonia solani]|uniref:Uncharacterized protein n=1 Tax=Rhizoctonia solani TaxID=456999 RepID=A0A8H3E8D6_9AGAM|nr:unnamed protein product [Rhizoctonia solani]